MSADKGERGLNPIGRSRDLVCDFERHGLRDDAGVGTQLSPSVGQRFADRVHFNRCRLRYPLFWPHGRRLTRPSTLRKNVGG